MTPEIFVPRLMDASDRNPQNNNARMLLSRWSAGGCRIRTLAYDAPDPRVATRDGIEVVRLWRRHAWRLHLFLQYLRPASGIFYPGVTSADLAGVRTRRALGMRVPIVATLEGLVGDDQRERLYSNAAGHHVYCQPVTDLELARCDRTLEAADHVVAISPFLARMGKARYGDKFSVLPLGLDSATFHPATERSSHGPRAPQVVCAGRVAPHKRPEVFLALAATYPTAQFTWFGDGEARADLIATANARGLGNLGFPGAIAPQQLADAFRKASIFVLPSRSEGVPKVTQEAAACGLPVIAFGHYETPSVEHGRSGFVVWSDAELTKNVGQLLGDDSLRLGMGRRGAEMMSKLGWDAVAPLWQQLVCAHLRTDAPNDQHLRFIRIE
jgi:glycosyltransferase involved in cell wall biosynthesis